MEPQANTSTRNHEFNYFYKLLSIQFWVIFGGWGSYRIRIHRYVAKAGHAMFKQGRRNVFYIRAANLIDMDGG